MTTRSGQEYSVYVQTMSGMEQTGMENEEPGLTQLLDEYMALWGELVSQQLHPSKSLYNKLTLRIKL